MADDAANQYDAANQPIRPGIIGVEVRVGRGAGGCRSRAGMVFGGKLKSTFITRRGLQEQGRYGMVRAGPVWCGIV